jgi:adenylosuccinate synthase
LDVLSRVEVQYVTLPGWQSSITEITNVTALPENCQQYLKFIQSFLDVPIEWIGVGPRRESMLKVSDSSSRK